MLKLLNKNISKIYFCFIFSKVAGSKNKFISMYFSSKLVHDIW